MLVQAAVECHLALLPVLLTLAQLKHASNSNLMGLHTSVIQNCFSIALITPICATMNMVHKEKQSTIRKSCVTLRVMYEAISTSSAVVAVPKGGTATTALPVGLLVTEEKTDQYH